MEDICKKNYAGFLEKMLEALVEMPIEGLCVIGKMKEAQPLSITTSHPWRTKSCMLDLFSRMQPWIC